MDMASAPDILAPYLVRFKHTPNALESLEIFEQCLDDMKAIYTERLDNAKVKLDEVNHTQITSALPILWC